MELSKILGVERDVEFGVEGHYAGLYPVTFKISTFLGECEYLMYRWSAALNWGEAEGTMVCSVIAAAPDGIIHLPPPLTDEQREQLKAIWTLGGRWLAKGKDERMFAYDVPPLRSDSGYWWNCQKIFKVPSQLSICGLVSPNSTIPFDIGKALGVEG